MDEASDIIFVGLVNMSMCLHLSVCDGPFAVCSRRLRAPRLSVVDWQDDYDQLLSELDGIGTSPVRPWQRDDEPVLT